MSARRSSGYHVEAAQQKSRVNADTHRPAIRHRHLTEDDFITCFEPIPNLLDEAASFDFGEGGCLFGTAGPELEFVRAQPLEKVWTIVEGDEGLGITEGMHVVNRLGYLVTRHPCPPDTMVTVDLDE